MNKSLLGEFRLSLLLLVLLLVNFSAIATVARSFLPQKATRVEKPVALAEATGPAPIIVDHTSIELFEQIPEEYLEAARNMRVLFSDRSVGQNINESLDCLTANSWATSINACRVDWIQMPFGGGMKLYRQADRDNGTVPSRILFDPSPTKYNRSNWTFVFRGGSWQQLTQNFLQDLVPTYVDSKDVLTYQFSYLNVNGGDIASPTTGFFAAQPGNNTRWDISDIEEFETNYPDKKFFYWTSSLARGIGSQVATDFNQQMRNYAIANNKILFDVADIESHDAHGNLCYDNRDGVAYTSPQGQYENNPDDGQNTIAMCQDYTTETDGGHLGTVAGARIRLAKGFWVLMAQLAGWDPNNSSVTPTPLAPGSGEPTVTPTTTIVLPTATPTSTVMPTTTSTPIPTVTSVPPTGGNYFLNFNSLTSAGSSCSACVNSNVVLTTGVSANAYEFNGTNSKVTLGTLNLLQGRSAFTVSYWIRPNFDETEATYSKYMFVDGYAFSMFYLAPIRDFRVLMRTGYQTSVRLDTVGLNWNPNTWHMLTFTYDGVAMKLYWDGQLKSTGNATGTVYVDNASAKLGISPVNSEYYSGGMDELSIYPYALNASEVSSLYYGI